MRDDLDKNYLKGLLKRCDYIHKDIKDTSEKYALKILSTDDMSEASNTTMWRRGVYIYIYIYKRTF